MCARYNVDDYIGKKYGRLTILEKDEERSKKFHNVYVTCACDCGMIAHARLSSIIEGETKSCGCLLRKNNAYDLSGEYGELYILDKKMKFKFDLEDYDKIHQHTWHVTKDGYAVSETRVDKHKQSVICLHRLAFNRDVPEGYEVDHIDGDAKNNMKSNLRLSTRSQNARNLKIQVNNTSGCPGVVLNNKTGKWRARIDYEGERKELGSFVNKSDAIITRWIAEDKYYKEFARKSNWVETLHNIKSESVNEYLYIYHSVKHILPPDYKQEVTDEEAKIEVEEQLQLLW